MRLHSKLLLAMALSNLALGPIACTGSSWCADCEQATTILGLNYQPTNLYTVGTPIPVNPPNPAGGTPRIYEMTAGSLPAGLSLDPTTGRITGTPTTPGVFTLTIRGSNSANSASQTLQITVVPALPLALSYATPQVFPASTAIAVQLPALTQATPGIPTTYATTAGSLPAGLSLNADGTITGTPTTPGVYPFTVTATSGTRNAAASATYTVTPAGSLALNYATPLTFPAGTLAATQSAALVNPTPGVPTTFAVTAGSPPTGLSLNAGTGDITGTPTMPGVYPFTVTATNGTRTATSSPTYTVTPAAALALSYVTPRSFTAGMGIGAQVPTLGNATPGVPTTYALAGGSLPSGLSLGASTGDITGTPTTPGVFTFTVTATNGGRSASASATYTVVPAGALTLDYTSPQTFPIAAPIAAQLPTVTNATPGVPTTFALTAGTLPTGLTLNADGTITGTPTSAGDFPFTVTATNGSRTATASPTYTVNPPAPQGSYQSVITTVGVPLTLTPQNLGGPITAATLASGSLPTGMALNADGTITGSPTTTGVYPFTVQLCNGVSCMATALATITVNDLAVTPLGATYGNGSGVAGAPLSVPPTVTSGGPVTGATLQGGSLPTGMTLNADGTVSGTPTVAGTFTALVTLTNVSGGRVTVPVTITISSTGSTPLVASYPLGAGQVGAPLAVSPNPTSGGPVSSASLAGGVLPPGMTLNADGSITGTPTQPGSFVALVQLCNATGGCTVQTVQIDVNAAGTPLVTAYANATGPVGLPLSVTPAVTSGGPVTATTLLSGSVPPGMVLNADGSITGTPTQPGTYTLSLRLCNGAGGCETRLVTLTINPAAPAASYTDTTTIFGTPATKAPVSTGGPITSASITAGGGTGITVAGDGTLSVAGTTAVGTYNLTVRVCNAVNVCVDVPAKVVVNPGAPTSLNYASPVTYTTTVAIANNNPNPAGGVPTAYAVTSGTLPAGLAIDPVTGVLSGTPTAPTAGAVSITVTGSNAAGGVTQTLSITVLAYPTANLSSNPSTVPVGQSSSLTALFTGSASGTAVLTGDGISTPLTVTSGTSIPTGIEGTPGTLRAFTLTVTSPQGFTATSQTTVQWVAIPADTWTVTVPTAGGGPLTPGAGNLLNGQISITVPDQGQSLCGAVTLTVNKEAALPGAILSTVRDYSQTFNIASNLGYPFRVPITITLAYDPTLASPNLAATDLPMAFYWDPSYSKWVSTGVKSVDTTAHTVTFTTLLPGRYVVLGIPGLTLATQNLGFASGTDDWRQNNPAVYDLPGGASLGMGSFASWYFPFAKASNGGTGLSNLFPTVGDANAAALISRLGNGTMDSWEAVWNQGAYSLTPKQTGLALVTGLMVTGQPQILLMGDARPAVNTAVATAVYGFNNGTGKFSVLDPNYPGTSLTLTWNSGTGAFSAYDRAAGYSPALAQYAFEGQTSVHRLADYDRVFSGAASGFPPATFATIAITDIAGIASPDLTQDVLVSSNLNVTISGTVTNGDETATHIYWSQNGSAPRVAVPLSGNSFSFTIPALADPYSTTVALETTATPCDPTFSHSGFKKFMVKQSGLSPWFPNMCFESGSTTPWTLQQSSNNGRAYPTDAPAALQANATPTWNAAGEISNYGVTGTWTNGSADSTLVTPGNDPRVASIPMVLDGGYAFRVNDPSNGAHISRLFQDITVPASVARPKLSFYWAAVLEDNGHPASQQPYVEVLVEDLDSIVAGHPEILFYKYFYANDTKYVGWVKGTGLWWGIPWQKVSLNLQGSIRAGHRLRVRVTASDCTQTGHGGIAYIDSIGCN